MSRAIVRQGLHLAVLIIGLLSFYSPVFFSLLSGFPSFLFNFPSVIVLQSEEIVTVFYSPLVEAVWGLAVLLIEAVLGWRSLPPLKILTVAAGSEKLRSPGSETFLEVMVPQVTHLSCLSCY